MISWLLSAFSALGTYPPELMDAIAHVESRGDWTAVGAAGERGAFQIQPRFSPVPAPLLHLPLVGRAEAARHLRYWQRRANGDLRRGLASFNCGTAGLRDKCGQQYARAVLRRVK